MHRAYFTFGQAHVHCVNGKTLDKDCLGVIEAKDATECRELAFEWFEGRFHNQYNEEPGDEIMQYYPRGFVYINCSEEQS